MTNPPAVQVKLPVIYEDAIRDLVACQTLDEAKYFSDKAEALAAWAKIYKSDQATVEAKRLKLHAYRRMGEIALAIRPPHAPRPGGRGSNPGAYSLIVSHGFSKSYARNMTHLARMAPEKFSAAIECPQSPSALYFKTNNKLVTPSWSKFQTRGANQFRSFCRSNSAKELARGMTADEANSAIKVLDEIHDWLDEFEQHLPKERK